MVEENQIGEFAVIFNRQQTDNEKIEAFIPVRVVEGYYRDLESCFVDANQNVYQHMASGYEFGNVFACRTNIIDLINKDQNASIIKIKKGLLDNLNQYEFFKCNDEDAEEFGFILTRNKETGEVLVFRDKDTDEYYEMLLDDEEEKKEEKILEGEETPEIERKTIGEFTPAEIIAEVKKTIKGQDEAIEEIVTLLWTKYHFPMIGKTNMMVIGPSGVGKTAIFKKLRDILGIPLAIYSATGNSQAGYKGHDIEEMLSQLFFNCGGDIEKAQNGIVIIDEFDKLSNNRENGEVGTTAIQNELLKLVEGCERTVQIDAFSSFVIDTSNIIFVGCGAFSDLLDTKKETAPVVGFGTRKEEKTADDIIVDTDMIINKGGIIRELAGRLPAIIKLKELSRENLRDIILNSDESKLKAVIESIESTGITVENVDVIIEGLIDEAINAKIGARGFTKSVMKAFLIILKDIGNNPDKYDKLVFGNNIINDNTDYKLISKKVKKRSKTAEA